VRARDRALGVFLGILLGLAVIILFLFLGSRGAIDTPDISGNEIGGETTTTPTTTAPEPGSP